MTLLEALNTIEDPEIRRRAVEQAVGSSIVKEYNSAAAALAFIKDWHKTKEGGPFWDQVHLMLCDDAQPRFADLCHLIPGYASEPSPEHPAVTLLRSIMEQAAKQPVTITPGNAWGNAINQILNQ